MAVGETLVGPPLAESLVGTTLRGTYLIREVLDQGGMGMVFAAEHVRLRKSLAVKVLASHLSDDPHALARFHREAEIISQLNHPSIVQVVDFDATPEGEPYLVMELLEGESLDARLEREERLPLQEAIRITAQAASGLNAAHRADIVHRDLKPGNVFLMNVPGEGSFVKLLDFGISKCAGAQRGLTGEFDILGTPDYMAPEQASGKTALVDHRGDQFALAVICYQMLTGTLPFAGNDVMEILRRVLHDVPRLPSQVAPWLPEGLDDVILKALSKDPDHRFVSIVAFAQALASASGCSLPPTISVSPHRDSRPGDGPVNGGRAAITAPAPTVQLPTNGAGTRSSSPVTATRSRSRGRLVSSVTAEAVTDLLDQAREALDQGDTETAVSRAEEALDLAENNDDALARRSVEGAETLLSRVYEQRIGKLTQVVEVNASRSHGATLSPRRAFLLSRLEGGVTFEEALDLTPMPRQQALRELVQLLRDGLIAAR